MLCSGCHLGHTCDVNRALLSDLEGNAVSELRFESFLQITEIRQSFTLMLL